MILHTTYLGSMPSGFKQDFLCFPYMYICLCNACDPRMGPFRPQVHTLNILGSCYVLNIKGLGLVVLDKIFSRIPYISLCKTSEPWGGLF